MISQIVANKSPAISIRSWSDKTKDLVSTQVLKRIDDRRQSKNQFPSTKGFNDEFISPILGMCLWMWSFARIQVCIFKEHEYIICYRKLLCISNYT